MNGQVECHSGSEYAGRPTAFLVEGIRHAVKRVVDEWRDPQGKHFLVENELGELFELTWLEMNEEWVIQLAQGRSLI